MCFYVKICIYLKVRALVITVDLICLLHLYVTRIGMKDKFVTTRPTINTSSYHCTYVQTKIKIFDLIVKYSVFGNTRYWVYSIEWKKRGLPHAYILIWLEDKSRAEEIDQIISPDITDTLSDAELFDIVTSHMIHEPCDAFNMRSPCMKDG